MSSAEKPARWRARPGRLSVVRRSAAPSLVEAPPRLAAGEIYRFFWPFARPYRWHVLLATLLSLAESALQAAGLWIFKILIDQVLAASRTDRLPALAIALAGVTLGASTCAYSGSLLASWVSGRFLSDVRRRFFNSLLQLPPDFFERSRLGDVLSRVSSDVAAIERFSLSGFRSSATAVFRLSLLAVLLVILSPRLAVMAVLVGPLFWLTASLTAGRSRTAARETRRRAGDLSALAEETLANVALVQLSGTEGREGRRFDAYLDAHRRAELRGTKVRAGYTPAIDTIELAGGLAVIWVGSSQVRSGALTVGELLVFIAYLTQLYGPLRRLGRVLGSVQSASASAERVIEYFRLRPAVVDREGARDLQHARGEIRFEGVTFRYPGASRDALRDVSFTVQPGESVAIVGANGAGKSTIMKLLLRWYDVDGGAVRIDGHDVRELTLATLRRQVAAVLQESLAFDGTIAENIAYGADFAPEVEVAAAARLATVDQFIEQLAAGYQHRVGQKGRRLSGGQRQKVAIARAVLRNAPIVVLDEPTASLDPESSRTITQPLCGLLGGRTTVVISHDLLTVQAVDRIVVLDDGVVVEQGTHTDLLAAAGRYAALYQAAQGGRASGVPDARSAPAAGDGVAEARGSSDWALDTLAEALHASGCS